MNYQQGDQKGPMESHGKANSQNDQNQKNKDHKNEQEDVDKKEDDMRNDMTE